ncbi:MAG TPA: BTAD domain-containing putative transcriptional regulator [Fimbriimonadaceae bacterium]|nr:BTAD domain-containing putative transcriptional regulator [Fimbriimonadaceae bacterium]HRJ32759.1 BTAD domain-containing putative transcriptional regulator [Fimbriimonadaceae bacterium]
MGSSWFLQLFGEHQARWHDQSIRRFPTRKAALLLARVGIRPGKLIARDDLTALLWPDDPVEDARERFRQTLSQLRRSLQVDGAPLLLESDRQTVWARAESVESDVDSFERLVKRGLSDPGSASSALEQALALYHGPLLPGWEDEWVLQERDALTLRRLQAAQALARIYDQQGRSDEALELAYQAARDDRLHEATHQWLLTLLVQRGQKSEALRRFQEFRDSLRDFLGLEPSPATAKILDQEPGVSTTPNAAPLTPPVESPTRHHHFPVPLTPLIGRQAEVETILNELSDARRRLLTITGPGGIGKSRLQLEIAQQIAEKTPHRVIFATLSEVRHASEFEPQIRRALGLADGHPVPEAQIRQALSAVPTLLLLDNLEHLADDLAPRVRRLLEDVPDLMVLGSSRVLLQVPGEVEIPLGPLPPPASNFDPDPLASPCVQLLVERIHQRLPDMTFDNDQIEALVQLARFLEGYPLALEIAAARIGLLSPASLLKQLQSRLSLVETRRRDIADRHSSMRSAIDWSYEHLEPETQRLFRILSVFVGPISLRAIQTVSLDPDFLDRLEELRLNSLIQIETHHDQKRVRLLETLREYAVEAIDPEDAEHARERLLEYLHALAHEGAELVNTARQSEANFSIQRELENFRAISRWVIESRPDRALTLLEALTAASAFWLRLGARRELRTLLETLLPLADPPLTVRAQTHHALGRLNALSDDFEEGLHQLNLAREAADQAGDGLVLGDVLATLAVTQSDWQNYEEAEQWAHKALNVRRQTGPPLRLLRSLEFAMRFYSRRGDVERAMEFGQEALQLVRAHGDYWAQGHTGVYYAGILIDMGRIEEARALAEEILASAQHVHEESLLPMALDLMADVLSLSGEYEEARRLCDQGCEIRLNYSDMRGGYSSLRQATIYHSQAGAYSDALRSLTRALRIAIHEGPYHKLAADLMLAAELAFRVSEPSTAASILAARERAIQELELPRPPEDDPDWLAEAERAAEGRWGLAFERGQKWNLVTALSHLDSALLRRG